MIDVGVQFHSEFLMEAFPKSHHILIEPASEYHSFIKNNYSNFNYTLLPHAVSSERREYSLLCISAKRDGKISHTKISEQIADSAFIRLQQKDPGFYLDCKRIDSITLDQIVDKFNLTRHNYIIKIDVDGLEPSIIRSSKKAIQDATCLMVESSTGVRYTSDRDIGKLIPQVEKLNMKLVDIVSPCYYNSKLCQVDLVFINKDLWDKYSEKEDFNQSLWQSDKDLIFIDKSQ